MQKTKNLLDKSRSRNQINIRGHNNEQPTSVNNGKY
jgi:hypothetical protein